MSTQVVAPAGQPIPAPADPSTRPGEAKRERLERGRTYGDLLEYLKNTCRRVEDEDKSERLNILKQQNLCQAFYDDRSHGKFNDRGEWEAYDYDPKELLFFDNRYKEQVDKLEMEMARSYVDLNVEPVDKTDRRMVEASEYVRGRMEANRKRLFTQRPEFILAENKALLLKTITYRYTYFDAQAEDGPREKRPTFDPVTLGEAKSAAVCAVCRTPRDEAPPVTPADVESANEEVADGLQSPTPLISPCPTCGSTSIKTLSASPVKLVLPTGEEEVPAGLTRCVHADPTMVQISLNARNMDIRSTPFLVWTQMVERGKLEQMFPDATIPASDDDSGEQARYRRENETAVSNGSDPSSSTTMQGGEQFRKLKFKLIWLDAWVYADYPGQKTPAELPGGKVLPPDTPLTALFPRGLCIAMVGRTPLAMWGEDKNKKWSMCVFGLREHALHGSGTNSLIPIQRSINDLLSYRMTNVYINTAPREFIRKDAIQGETLPKMNEVCVVTNVDAGERIIGNIYDRAPGTSLPAEVNALSQERMGSIQEQAGTSSLSLAGTSAQSQALGTATGIAAMRDLAVGRMGPNLMLKAAMEVETAFQILEAEQANYSRQQLLALAGLRPGRPAGNLGYTEQGVDAFLNCDVRASFVITPTPGSWMPVTEQEKKADALAMADASSKIQNPEVLANVAKALKQPLSVGGWNATEREAARRLEEFAEVAQVLESSGYRGAPEEGALEILTRATSATMDAEMDNHQAFIDFNRDWWVSDESRNASVYLKAAVRQRTLEHKNALTGAVTEANAREVETQVPGKVAEMAARQVDAAQGMEEEAARQNLQQRDRELQAVTGAAASGDVPLAEAAMIKDAILSQ